MKDHVLKAFSHTMQDAEKLVADVACDACADTAHNIEKHPAWVLAHLTVGAQYVSVILGKRDKPDEALAKAAAPGTPVSANRADYPTKDELLAGFKAAHAEASEAFAAASDEHLASELPMPEYREFWPTIADAMFYMMVRHEPFHLGQLTQWRKATGRAPVNAF